jgi:hypothetical protein
VKPLHHLAQLVDAAVDVGGRVDTDLLLQLPQLSASHMNNGSCLFLFLALWPFIASVHHVYVFGKDELTKVVHCSFQTILQKSAGHPQVLAAAAASVRNQVYCSKRGCFHLAITSALGWQHRPPKVCISICGLSSAG